MKYLYHHEAILFQSNKFTKKKNYKKRILSQFIRICIRNFSHGVDTEKGKRFNL